ncbi:MAG TPA: hypothetical protein VKU01_02210 [Bryobacteraceae bacterium]|nr:hypothetical protein [Bryobacteraceae bacterium]
MKSLRIAVALLCLAPFVSRAAEIPRPAPDLAITMPDGSKMSLSEFKGKVTFVCFILTT